MSCQGEMVPDSPLNFNLNDSVAASPTTSVEVEMEVENKAVAANLLRAKLTVVQAVADDVV